MTGKKYEWHKLADHLAEIKFSANNMTEVKLAGKSMCIALHKEQLFCSTNKCPHAGGNLADGYIDAAGNIVCPLHRYKFNLQNGRNSSGEGYCLKTFPVEIRKDGVFVGFEVNNFLNWLK